jgi:hypothetical protein
MLSRIAQNFVVCYSVPGRYRLTQDINTDLRLQCFVKRKCLGNSTVCFSSVKESKETALYFSYLQFSASVLKKILIHEDFLYISSDIHIFACYYHCFVFLPCNLTASSLANSMLASLECMYALKALYLLFSHATSSREKAVPVMLTEHTSLLGYLQIIYDVP